MNNPKTLKEFNIDVPWGHIAVKAWGNENNEVVIVAHGRLDNAGAFDRLIPYLPDSFYYICVDLPGHGRSSHFPPYLPIYTVNYVLVFMLLAQYFKQKCYTIIGHSYGAQVGFLFAQLYPNSVKKLIMLDSVHIIPVEVKEYKHYLIENLEASIRVLEKQKTGTPPTYTYEEALNKLLNGRQGAPLTVEAGTALLQRGVEETNDGRYKFTFDQRMKSYINPLHDFRYILENLKADPVTCPILIILAKQARMKRLMKPLINILKTWKNVSIVYLNGYHDIHNNNPEFVAPFVNKFLLSQKAKL